MEPILAESWNQWFLSTINIVHESLVNKYLDNTSLKEKTSGAVGILLAHQYRFHFLATFIAFTILQKCSRLGKDLLCQSWSTNKYCPSSKEQVTMQTRLSWKGNNIVLLHLIKAMKLAYKIFNALGIIYQEHLAITLVYCWGNLTLHMKLQIVKITFREGELVQLTSHWILRSFDCTAGHVN